MRHILTLAGLTLAFAAPAMLAASPPAGQWEIGPIIRGKNYSVGMPLRPAPARTGWSFDFPYPNRDAGHVHYVTFDPGTLAGKSRIVVRYRVDARSGTRFVPQEHPDLPGTVSLFLQRRGDNWSARGLYNFYRWYAPGHSVRELAPGTGEIVVRLDDPEWVAVLGGNSGCHRQEFREALARTSSLGLVFGSTSARGHGVYSTAPARFELTEFRVE
jgi:hypothetical protein